LFLSSEDEVTLQFVEEWTDVDALRSHSQSPHLAAFKEARENRVAKGGTLKVFEAKEIPLG
jgi:quinol monooxygenase YgiN